MTGRKYPVSSTLRSKLMGDGLWDVEFSLSNLGRNQKNMVEEMFENLIESIKKAENENKEE